MAAIAYYFLVQTLLGCHRRDSTLARSIGSDAKGRVSVVIYGLGIPLACWQPWIAITLYLGAAIVWLAPDRRIEKNLID